MNGLKYIRTRCNLSLNELAEMIGVTRQALSAWENGRKDIPQMRKKQLEDFLGIDACYFGEITEKEREYLQQKALFRYDENGKEYYRYKMPEVGNGPAGVAVHFMKDSDESLDEEYAKAQRRKQAALDHIDDIIKWTKHAGTMEGQTMCINRGCRVYEMINQLMEAVRGNAYRGHMRMPFFYEMVNVWKAMLLAFDLIEKEELSYLDKTEYYCGEDGAWIEELAEYIKAHWKREEQFHEEHHREVKRTMAESRMNRQKQTETQDKSADVQIAEAEARYKQWLQECPDMKNQGGLTVYMK